jgi:hypothetical protein
MYRKLLRRNDWIRRSSGSGLAGRIAAAIVLSLGVGVVLAGGARAQIVTNGNFEVPSVASAPNGYLYGSAPALNVSGVGWTFPSVAGGYSGVTIEGNAGVFDAPSTSDSSQVGLIVNLGQIWQPVKLAPGAYTLSFKLAQRAGGLSQGKTPPIPLPILVFIGQQQFGPFSPTSSTSYDQVRRDFEIPTGGSDVFGLSFVGTGDPYQDNVDVHTTFIDAVSITPIPPKKPPAPVITRGPSDIYPTTSISLQGSNFGSKQQTIKIVFPNASETTLSNGSMSEINLNSVGADDVVAFTQPIDGQYPTGKVEQQTVDVTLISGDTGLASNVWHAKFHDSAVITSGSSAITPGQEFFLRGWDFDSKAQCSSGPRGKVTVYFPLKSAVTFNSQTANASNSYLDIPITSKEDCQPDYVKITLPPGTQGVVRQTVDISYESPAGRKSNAWKAEFTPKLVTLVAPYYWVVASCAEQSASDNCNNGKFGSCWSGPVVLWGVLGYWPPDVDSMVGDHNGCWGLSSDNGTDTYTLQLPIVGANGKPLTDPKDGWVASGMGGWNVQSDNAIVGNGLSTGGCPDPLQDCFPTTFVQATVSWHIGATGGVVDYTWDIHIQGPVGVPLPFPGAAYPPYD